MRKLNSSMVRALAAGVMVAGLAACTPAEIAAIQQFQYGQAQSHPPSTVEDAIARHFPDNPASATRVARCESGLDPSAVSRGGGNYGLFQINKVHASDFETVTGRPWSDVLDADTNAQYARHLYEEQDWRPWACRWAA